jgi:cell division protein FtsI (penicillin-binding protein 3)
MVGIVFAALAGVLGWRLVSLQILEPDRYLARGAAQRIRTVVLPAGRGAIVDRNGVDLALSVPRRSVVADPRLIEDPSSAAWAMAAVLDTDVSVLERRLASDRSFVYLDRQVADDVADSALALDLAGVYTIKELARLRPGDDSALALLGRTDIDNNGVSGLELVYDGMLSGVPGEMIIEVGARGSTIPGGEYRVAPADEGLSIVLTIDRALQFEAERLLAEGVEAAGGAGGVLVAMVPGTGEILASATVARDADGVVRPSTEHRAATWTFEPGSIVKPLTISAVLETGTATPDTVREVPGLVVVHDSDFGDSFPHGTEQWSVADILRRSSNIGTILWAQDLGAEALYDQLLGFGLGSVTDLDFPGEASGILLPVGRWSGTSLPTIAIGQGVSTTPIQMITAFATLANEGRRPAPTLVLGSRDDGGVFTPIPAAASIEVIPPGVAHSRDDARSGRGRGHRKEWTGSWVPGGRQDGNGLEAPPRWRLRRGR